MWTSLPCRKLGLPHGRIYEDSVVRWRSACCRRGSRPTTVRKGPRVSKGVARITTESRAERGHPCLAGSRASLAVGSTRTLSSECDPLAADAALFPPRFAKARASARAWFESPHGSAAGATFTRCRQPWRRVHHAVPPRAPRSRAAADPGAGFTVPSLAVGPWRYSGPHGACGCRAYPHYSFALQALRY